MVEDGLEIRVVRLGQGMSEELDAIRRLVIKHIAERIIVGRGLQGAERFGEGNHVLVINKLALPLCPLIKGTISI